MDKTVRGLRRGQQILIKVDDLVKLRACALARIGVGKGQVVLLKEQLRLQYLLKCVFFVQARALAPHLWNDPKLLEKLADPDPLVRWLAANFIARKRLPALKELIKCLDDPIDEVREAARQALVRQARSTDFGPRPHDSQARVREAMKHWNAWLSLQDPLSLDDRAGLSGSLRADPFAGYLGERKKK